MRSNFTHTHVPSLYILTIVITLFLTHCSYFESTNDTSGNGLETTNAIQGVAETSEEVSSLENTKMYLLKKGADDFFIVVDSTTTDKNAEFLFSDIEHGSYKVYATTDDNLLCGYLPITISTREIENKDPIEISIDLINAVTLTGQTHTTTQQTEIHLVNSPYTTINNTDGTFDIPAVFPAEYTVEAIDLESGNILYSTIINLNENQSITFSVSSNSQNNSSSRSTALESSSSKISSNQDFDISQYDTFIDSPLYTGEPEYSAQPLRSEHHSADILESYTLYEYNTQGKPTRQEYYSHSNNPDTLQLESYTTYEYDNSGLFKKLVQYYTISDSAILYSFTRFTYDSQNNPDSIISAYSPNFEQSVTHFNYSADTITMKSYAVDGSLNTCTYYPTDSYGRRKNSYYGCDSLVLMDRYFYGPGLDSTILSYNVQSGELALIAQWTFDGIRKVEELGTRGTGEQRHQFKYAYSNNELSTYGSYSVGITKPYSTIYYFYE